MYLVRGRAATPTADHAATAAILDRTVESRESALRIWTPHRQVVFGRRDANEQGYDTAREAARNRAFTPTERSVGGRAVAYTGTTLAFAHALPIDDPRQGMSDRYEATTASVRQALLALDIDVTTGEPPGSFCPGSHSLQAGGKIVGIAQRIHNGAALISGIVIVDDRSTIAAVLEPVYDALGITFDPGSVGSVAAAGGPRNPNSVARSLEAVFVADEPRTILPLEQFVSA